MKVHSTGLGQEELIAKQDKLEVVNGYFLYSIRTIEPVHWHIRVLMDRNDVWNFIIAALQGPIFLWLMSLIKKLGPPPKNY